MDEYKCSKKIFESFIIKALLKYNKINPPNYLLLDPYNPFWDILIKKDLVELFQMKICIFMLESDDIQDYSFIFNKLNKSNAKFPKISLDAITNKELKLLSQMNINFNKIKKLMINDSVMSHNSYYQLIPTEIFVKIFSLFTIKNNLIEISIITMNQVDGYKFDLINQFTSLKSLFYRM